MAHKVSIKILATYTGQIFKSEGQLTMRRLYKKLILVHNAHHFSLFVFFIQDKKQINISLVSF